MSDMKPVQITETILRDAHQSLIATRMSTEQMLPIVEKLDQVGYHSLECWGGATFDASLRFLHEDPWERLRKIKDKAKKTPLQMLFRGQNILGYRPYGDAVVEYFVQKSIANGIDIIRIFDCLNDLRNLQTAVKAANKEKGHAQVALSYTLGDAYTLEYWTTMAKNIEEMGANSICIKDMAGLLLPYKATELVKALKETVKIPIQLHTHYTSGVASMTYLKAVEAGHILDTDGVRAHLLDILRHGGPVFQCIRVAQGVGQRYLCMADVYKRQLAALLCCQTLVGQENLSLAVIYLQNLNFHRIAYMDHCGQVYRAVAVLALGQDTVGFVANVQNGFIFFDINHSAFDNLSVSYCFQ